jgi:hypothetical protein
VVNDLNIEMGYIYHSSAVIPEDTNDNRLHENPRESKGRPGTRAPHVWLAQDGRQISTLDLFGRNFALLGGSESSAWCKCGEEASKKLRIDLDEYRLGASGLTDPNGEFLPAFGIDSTGAVLVRPDGFVAWRAKTGDGASTVEVESALSTILSR